MAGVDWRNMRHPITGRTGHLAKYLHSLPYDHVDCKGLIKGGSMRTTTLELARAFLATTQLDDILERSWLRELAYAGNIQLDTPLLVALVKRWDQDCCSFNLPIDEMTIMLLDVYRIWGLPVRGTLVQQKELSDDNVHDQECSWPKLPCEVMELFLVIVPLHGQGCLGRLVL